MKQKNISIFLGEQCRKYRKIFGITQEELAEKMNTTPQTISNYERMGIKDVDVENEISRILGVNLREETEENEGEPGELGKEILLYLMEHEGNCLVKDLLDEKILYGISEDRLDHEIEKLAKKDMCCREEDYFREKSDVELYSDRSSYITKKINNRLFITAKGIITTRNFITNQYQAERINSCSNIKSYEMLLAVKSHGDKMKKIANAKDMEEYYELRPWHDQVKHITNHINTNYKADYLSYLKRNWLPEFGLTDKWDDSFTENEWNILFPGKSFCHDLMYRMAFGFTNEWRNEKLRFRKNEDLCQYPKEDIYFKGYIEEMNSEFMDGDIAVKVSNDFHDDYILDKIFIKKIFCKNMGTISDEDIEGYSTNPFYESQEAKQEHESIFDEKNLKEILYKNVPDIEELIQHPMKWFTKDNLEKFIKENYKKPVYDEESFLEEKIHEIEKLIPEAREEYYQFPKSWEENGLADLVRDVCCLNY